jgi:peptidoglycan-N-acetylglucosamine deacetylase
VRSALSAGSRRSLAALSALLRARSHGRALGVAIGLLIAFASAGVVALAASTGHLRTGPPGSESASAGASQLVAPLVGESPVAGAIQYRIVGCRSHGAGAYRSGPPRREVAIGFDDGPYPDTPAFVRMLAASHAQATFFMIGRQITTTYRSTMLHELREGDVLGDHTFTHPDLTRTPDVRGQLERTLARIRTLSGYTPCVFRPPYGDYDDSVLAIARSLGLATVTWNVDPSDYVQPGTRTIEQRVLAQVQPGSIIISHDGGGPRAQTLAAYPAIIAALRRRGYRIVTIPQLLDFRPVYVHCVRLCDGIGIARRQVPRDAIVERAP